VCVSMRVETLRLVSGTAASLSKSKHARLRSLRAVCVPASAACCAQVVQ